jgi:hypothetical protein
MNVIAPRLEVELDTTAGHQGELNHLIEKRRGYGAIGFPADAKDPACGLSRASLEARIA